MSMTDLFALRTPLLHFFVSFSLLVAFVEMCCLHSSVIYTHFLFLCFSLSYSQDYIIACYRHITMAEKYLEERTTDELAPNRTGEISDLIERSSDSIDLETARKVEVEASVEGSEQTEEVSDAAPKKLNACQRFLNFILPPGGMIASSFTLCSAVLGGGILALPHAFHNMGYATGLILLVIVTLVSIFGLWLLARAADISGQCTYEDCIKHLINKPAGYGVALCMIQFSIGGGSSYIVTFGNILSVVFDDDSIPHFLRTTVGNRLVVAGLFLVLILPLCLPRNIDSLRHTSAIGVAAITFFTICVVVDSSMYLHRNGWRDDMIAFNSGNSVISSLGTLIYACMVHMNAFEVYHDMKRPTPRCVVRNSTLALCVCGLLYALCGFFGYARFGVDMESSILLMYQPRVDKVFWAAYIGVVVKLCVAFALHQLPMRNGIYHFLNWNVYNMSWIRNALLNAFMATLVMVMGLFIPNIAIIFDLVGSMSGGFLTFVYPALAIMYTGGWTLKKVGYFEYLTTYFLLFAGVAAVVFGTVAAVKNVVELF